MDLVDNTTEKSVKKSTISTMSTMSTFPKSTTTKTIPKFTITDHLSGISTIYYIVDIQSSEYHDPIVICYLENNPTTTQLYLPVEHLFKISKTQLKKYLPQILIENNNKSKIMFPIDKSVDMFVLPKDKKIFLYNPSTSTKIIIDINNQETKQWLQEPTNKNLFISSCLSGLN